MTPTPAGPMTGRKSSTARPRCGPSGRRWNRSVTPSSSWAMAGHFLSGCSPIRLISSSISPRVGASRADRQPLLVETFIAGDELTVGVIGNDPPGVLGIMRVVPKRPTAEFVYSLEVKRDWQNRVRYETPPAGYDEETLSVISYNAL